MPQWIEAPLAIMGASAIVFGLICFAFAWAMKDMPENDDEF